MLCLDVIVVVCAFVCFRIANSQWAALQVYSACSGNAMMALSCIPWYFVICLRQHAVMVSYLRLLANILLLGFRRLASMRQSASIPLRTFLCNQRDTVVYSGNASYE